MLRTSLLFLIFISFCNNVLSQNIDHYKNVAKTESDPTLKMVALDSVISLSFRKDNALFITKSLEYIELAKKEGQLIGAAKKAINLQHTLTYAMNDPRKAVVVIDGILSHKYKIKDSFLIGSLFNRRGKANYPIDLDAAIKDQTQAIKNYTTKNLKQKGDSYLERGHAHSSLGKFILANEDYRTAYNIFEEAKDYEYMLYAQQGITTMYSINGFYDKAKTERDKYIDKAEKLGLDHNFSSIYYNQAIDYEIQGKTDEELKYLLKAELELENDNSKQIFVSINSALASYYAREGEFDKAKKHLDNIEQKSSTLLDQYPTNRMFYAEAKATYYQKLEQSDNALSFAIERLNIAKKNGLGEEKRDSYKQVAEIQESLGNYKEAMTLQKSYIAIKDSIFNQSNAFTLAYYQTLYETEKKEKALAERNNAIALLENENSSFKKQVLFLAILAMVSFGVILLFRTQKHLRNNKTLQEKFSQKLLVSQEKERIRISKDLHDGLGQQLLLIKNKLIKSEDNGVKVMVENAIDEIRTISRDLHPFQLQELGITKAIIYALENIDENTNLFISSEIDNIDNLFSPEQEVNVYRIVQESLTNVIKHANAEAIKVSVMKLSKLIVITVKDNGIGFEFSEQYRNMHSLGLKTLSERTKFLDGQMRVQSIKNNGSMLEFQIPIK